MNEEDMQHCVVCHGDYPADTMIEALDGRMCNSANVGRCFTQFNQNDGEETTPAQLEAAERLERLIGER